MKLESATPRMTEDTYLLVVLIMDMERIKSKGEDFLLHQKCLLGIDAEGGVDANCLGQGRKANLLRGLWLAFHSDCVSVCPFNVLGIVGSSNKSIGCVVVGGLKG